LFRVKNVGLRVGIGSNPGRVSNPSKFFFWVTKWANPILGQSNKVAQPVIKRVDPFGSAH